MIFDVMNYYNPALDYSLIACVICFFSFMVVQWFINREFRKRLEVLEEK